MIWGFVTTLHTLAAVFWVGGIAFMLLILHPASGTLPPAERVALMTVVFRRFLSGVWLAIVILYITGIGLIFGLYGGMASTPLPIHIMFGVAHAMTALFLGLWFGPYRAFRRHSAVQDTASALAAAGRIRRFATANFVLGLLACTLGAGTAFWG